MRVVRLSCENPSFIKHSYCYYRQLQHHAFRIAELCFCRRCTIRQQGEEAFTDAVMVSLWCCCTPCMFAFAEVNGFGECVLNTNAQEWQTSKKGVRERKRRSPVESPWVWKLLANLSTLPPNWQVLSRDELSALSAACLICSRGERQGEKPGPNTTVSTSRPHKRPFTGAYCKHVEAEIEKTEKCGSWGNGVIARDESQREK